MDGRDHPGASGPEAPPVLALGDPRAADPGLAGGKAASLARAAAAGLPVLPGFVLTTAAPLSIDLDAESLTLPRELGRAYDELDGSQRKLVVRSSSTVEDAEASSMAGRFTSVIGVHGRDRFANAVATVLGSAPRAGIHAPMAVLVQPHLDAVIGGVMFTMDPVSGRRDRIVVSAAAGGPHRLVDGSAAGATYTLTRSGRMKSSGGASEAPLTRRAARSLARLAAAVEDVFGGPQDVEWAIEDSGRLWLLQSRPVTASSAAHKAGGPVLGPGPVAETFPDPLGALEQELWVDPLRDALTEALKLMHAAPRAGIRRSPVISTVGGRVVADLDLLGVRSGRRGLLARLDPRPPARRLSAAWLAGRLRAALPVLAADLADAVDARLAAVRPVDRLSSRELMALLLRMRRLLVALNGHEILAGMLLAPGTTATTAASAALRAVAAARTAGVSEGEIAARAPVTLALTPPGIGRRHALPHSVPAAPVVAVGPADPIATARERLRLRIRWVQELQARSAYELGVRLVRTGVLQRPEDVGVLTLTELKDALTECARPTDLDRRIGGAGPPLPAAFRLGPDGTVVAIGPGGPAGTGAGGGRGAGVVHGGDGPPPPGSVLVVRILDPSLAPDLPGLAGLVSETGSVLSHLAILARELGVPTVVGVPGALDRFPPGTSVVVDGISGTVTAAAEAAA